MPTVHPNYVKASNIVLLQAVIGLVNYFLFYSDMHIRHKTLVFVFLTVFSGVIIYLLRIGTSWMKYFFLIGFALSNGKPSNWAAMFNHGPIRIVITIILLCISIWVLWLLFTIPNQQEPTKKAPVIRGPK